MKGIWKNYKIASHVSLSKNKSYDQLYEDLKNSGKEWAIAKSLEACKSHLGAYPICCEDQTNGDIYVYYSVVDNKLIPEFYLEIGNPEVKQTANQIFFGETGMESIDPKFYPIIIQKIEEFDSPHYQNYIDILSKLYDKYTSANYILPKGVLGRKRENYLSCDEIFMLHAIVASSRSKDPNSQVGACIVGDDNRILSLGYNGAPNGWHDDEFPWDRDNENERYNKYPYVIHAEANALLNYKGDHSSLEGSTVYVTLFPCHECAKLLAQAGIKRVVYLSDKYLGTEDNKMSKTCLTYSGVKFEGFPLKMQRDFLVSLRANIGVEVIEKETGIKLVKKRNNNK